MWHRWPLVKQKAAKKENNEDDNAIHAHDGGNRGDVIFDDAVMTLEHHECMSLAWCDPEAEQELQKQY